MGKFRIVNAGLSIDFTHSGSYESIDPTLNIAEVDIHVSTCTGKRDPILRAQYDGYGYLLHGISASDYEDVFKVIINQECTFYPDQDEATTYDMIITKAKPYYRNSNVYKDSLILEMITALYGD